MVRLYAVLIFVVLLISGQVNAQDGRQSCDSMSKYMHSYYTVPVSSLVFASFIGCDLREVFRRSSDKPGALVDLMAVFFAHILHAEPAITENVVGTTAREGDKLHVYVVAIAVWLADAHPEKSAFLDALMKAWVSKHTEQELKAGSVLPRAKQMFGQMRQLQPFPFPNMVPQTPHHLDVMWTSFFATGDKIYVEKILTAFVEASKASSKLPGKPTGDGKYAVDKRELLQYMMAQTAGWSLTANARQHPAVREILENVAREKHSEAGTAAVKLLQPLANER